MHKALHFLVMHSTIRALLAVLIAVSFPAAAYAEKLKVVASFSILGDMVHEVAGDDVELRTLVGPNGDAHTYEPTPSDMRAIAAADLVVVNGLGFEGWLDRLIASSGYKGAVVVATQHMQPLTRGTRQDPHAWQSVANGKIYVATIRDALVRADPAHAVNYRERATRYLQRLDATEQWIKAQINVIPPERRSVITSHNAFHYLAQAYGITLVAPLGIGTENEASAADMARLIDQVRARKIAAVFLENVADVRLIRQLETDAHAYVGGMLYSDALSELNGAAPTYIAMLRHNITQLTQGMLHNRP